MLDRLLLREFLPLFGIGILTFSVLIASFTVLKEAVDYASRGIPLDIVIRGFLLGLAQVVAYTLPMAVLLGALLAFGRLSSSGEITAMRAGGVNFLRIAAPVLFAGYCIACLAFGFNERVAPQLTLQAQQLIKDAALKMGLTLSNKEISYYFFDKEQGKGYLLGANTSVGNAFNDFKLIEFSPDEILIYFARKAEWGEEFWTLREVRYLRWAPDAPEPVAPYTVESGELQIDLNKTPGEILRASRNPEEMSLAELGVFLQQKAQELETAETELVRLQADPSAEETVRQALADDVQRQRNAMLKNRTKYQLKIATPFSCMIFVLLAAPLGMNPLRSTSSVGFGLSMILVFVYYLLTTIAVNAAVTGTIPPIVLAWIPNTVFTFAGLYLNGQFVWSSGK
ncbi:MAG: hypothetical protein GEEBNDBF_01736 [bacterium]|nr:hypothetical protein [bacterium]